MRNFSDSSYSFNLYFTIVQTRGEVISNGLYLYPFKFINEHLLLTSPMKLGKRRFFFLFLHHFEISIDRRNWPDRAVR